MSKTLPGDATSAERDILAHCQSLQGATSVFKRPREIALPLEVAATLSAYSEVTWNDLDDVANVARLRVFRWFQQWEYIWGRGY